MSSAVKPSSLIAIWGALIVLLFVSVGIGVYKSSLAATVLIFAVATLKAYLVAAYYMGLKFEPRYVTWVLVTALAVVALLFFYLIPDIVYVYGKKH